MANDHLITLLAENIMGWRSAPGRFLTGMRGWVPNWRFQPLTNVEDALKVAHAASAGLKLVISPDGLCTAEAKVRNSSGRANSSSVAASITFATCRAVGLEVPNGVEFSSAPKPSRRKSRPS